MQIYFTGNADKIDKHNFGSVIKLFVCSFDGPLSHANDDNINSANIYWISEEKHKHIYKRYQYHKIHSI